MFIKIFSAFAFFNQVFSSETNEPSPPIMMGGQRDVNNCLTSAGYNWCESTQSCIRHWITPCADNYDDCNDCHKKQRGGENIACPTNCVNERDTSDCSNSNYLWCPTMNKCIDPKKEYCHRQSRPAIMEPDINLFPLVTDGYDRQAPDRLLSTLAAGGDSSPLIPPSPSTTCPIPYEDCDGDFVCPKVTEITRCSEGGIDGFTTYQLSLIINNPNVLNIYAIFGSREHNSVMSIPPAYQTSGIFGSNIGGVPQDIIDIHPDSRFDSWLTIGLTDGDPHDQLANIGAPFELWNEDTPLIVDDGAVFIMDPNEILTAGDEYVIAQLTLPSSAQYLEGVVINVQGQTTCVDCGDRRQTAAQSRWTQYNVNFELKPPEPIDPNTIPADCKLWYDGCNTCSVLNGVIGRCTHTMCIREDNAHCLDFNGGGH